MNQLFPVLLFLLSILTACSTSESQDDVKNIVTSPRDFSGKKFKLRVIVPNSPEIKDIEVTASFNRDTTGTFQIAVANKLITNPLIWRFVGDSLQLNRGSGLEHRFYTVTREQNGFLVTRDDEQLLLTPVQ